MLFGFLIKYKKNIIYIIQKLKNMLITDLNIHYNLNKITIVYSNKSILFLGYQLLNMYIINFKNNKTQIFKNNKIKFFVPIQKLIKYYSIRGFFQKVKKGKNIKYISRRVDK
jgi:hypothetical protein